MSNCQLLHTFDNHLYNPGGNAIKRILWYYTNAIFFKTGWLPISSLKCKLLRLFGAKVGKEVNIKPCVNIKYPWRLEIGDNVWIGENVWIDNLANVKLESNTCISQGAMLLCGNHNYKKSTFDLMIGDITIKEGAWVGAQSVVCPGVTLHVGSILTVGSVASNDLDAMGIYRGNPAIKVKDRIIEI